MDRSESQKTGRASFDEATLRRVRARDAAAMEHFFDHYFDRVYAHVIRVVGDPTVADDVTQEAFLRMNRFLDRIDPTRDSDGWVFTVATNAIRDHWRSRRRGMGRLEVEMGDDWNEPPARDQRSAQENLEQEQEAELIQRALGQLSPADREIILLRSYEEMGTEEIADALDITVEAVRQRHSRAVKRLGVAYQDLTSGESMSS